MGVSYLFNRYKRRSQLPTMVVKVEESKSISFLIIILRDVVSMRTLVLFFYTPEQVKGSFYCYGQKDLFLQKSVR